MERALFARMSRVCFSTLLVVIYSRRAWGVFFSLSFMYLFHPFIEAALLLTLLKNHSRQEVPRLGGFACDWLLRRLVSKFLVSGYAIGSTLKPR